jgi:hypothetical protein
VSRSNVLLLNPLNAKLNPICHLLALLGVHHILHVSGLRVNSTFPLDLQSVSFFNVFPTKLYVFITITLCAKCPNQSKDMKKLLYFDRAKFGVKRHDAIDDGGFVILQMVTASSRNCGVWAKISGEWKATLRHLATSRTCCRSRRDGAHPVESLSRCSAF